MTAISTDENIAPFNGYKRQKKNQLITSWVSFSLYNSLTSSRHAVN